MNTSRFTSAARFALGTAAVASLAVIAACTEGSVASNLAAPSLKFGESVGPSIANAHIADVCVSATSPDGVYTFQNSNYTPANGGTPQNDPGTTVRNDAATPGVAYTLTKNVGNPNPCVGPVLFRNSLNTVTDNFSGITVTNTGTPAGVAYSSTDCVDDPGVTITNPCGIASTIHANSFHGSKATYNFVTTVVSTGCTYTFGWYKNQGNPSVPNTSFFGTAASWKTVIATKGGSNKYYGLADQYIPAKLAIGAKVAPAAIATAITQSETFFTGRALGSTAGYSDATLTALAAVLDNFNNGYVAGWPHCL